MGKTRQNSRNDLIDQHGVRHRGKLRSYVHAISEAHHNWTSDQCCRYLLRNKWWVQKEEENGRTVNTYVHPDCIRTDWTFDEVPVNLMKLNLPVPPPFTPIEDPLVLHALNLYTESVQLLKTLKVISNLEDFTSQLGQYLIANWTKGRIEESEQPKDWNLLLHDGCKALVKSHANLTTAAVALKPFKYNEDADFEMLYIVAFTPDHTRARIYEMSKQQAMSRKYKNELTWDSLDDCLAYSGPIR
ncbi:hypothetical protein N9098_01065 [bacterium]|nr:hypothetical protein [bacterium]